jgi:hypothetical protein
MMVSMVPHMPVLTAEREATQPEFCAAGGNATRGISPAD